MFRLTHPMTQVVILGLVCFCCPGMFNAVNGIGAFGLDAKDTHIGDIASTALGVVFAFSSLVAGALFNLLGHRILLLLGACTYVLYLSSFLAYNHIHSLAYIVVAAMLLGVGAGWLWCAQGAIMMGYPLEGEKGKYISVFWAVFNAGGVFGNIIPIAIQWNSDNVASVSDWTYITFMCIMGTGAILSLFLLPASRITRTDGSPVTRVRYSSPMIEVRAILSLFRDWRMLALAPMFFTSNWFYNYQFNAVNAKNFGTIRTRSFNSSFYWAAQILASILFGSFLDRANWTRPTRAKNGLILLTIFLIATWGGGVVFQSTFGPHTVITDPLTGKLIIDKNDFHAFDMINTTAAWAGPFVLYFMYGVCDAMFQAYAYWLMGALTNDINLAARFAGFYKFVQNLGNTLSGVANLSSIGNAPAHPESVVGKGMGELWICIGLISLSIVFAIPVAWRAVKDTTLEDDDDMPMEKRDYDEYEDIKY